MSTMTEAALACCRISRRARTPGGYHDYGWTPGFHLPPWAWAAIIAYLVIHVAAGHVRHRRGGRRVTYGWSVARGPWAGVRLTRHLRWRS